MSNKKIRLGILLTLLAGLAAFKIYKPLPHKTATPSLSEGSEYFKFVAVDTDTRTPLQKISDMLHSHRSVGPAVSEQYGGGYFVIGDYDRSLLEIQDKPEAGKAYYYWHSSPENVVSTILVAERFADVQRENQDKKNQAVITGQCIIWHGKKYCTGMLCQVKGHTK